MRNVRNKRWLNRSGYIAGRGDVWLARVSIDGNDVGPLRRMTNKAGAFLACIVLVNGRRERGNQQNAQAQKCHETNNWKVFTEPRGHLFELYATAPLRAAR